MEEQRRRQEKRPGIQHKHKKCRKLRESAEEGTEGKKKGNRGTRRGGRNKKVASKGEMTTGGAEEVEEETKSWERRGTRDGRWD